MVRVWLLVLGVAGTLLYALFPHAQIRENLLGAYRYKCDVAGGDTYCAYRHDFRLAGHNRWQDLRNWSRMDSLVLVLRAQAPLTQLVFKILVYDADHTQDGLDSTLRPLVKEFPVSDTLKRISIPLSDFYVPPYWEATHPTPESERHNLGRRYAVVLWEILPGWDTPPGARVWEAQEVWLEGASNAHFVALVIYLVLLVSIAIGVRFAHRGGER
jgi:hypothetical protein